MSYLVYQIEEKNLRCNTSDFLTWITSKEKRNMDRKASPKGAEGDQAPAVTVPSTPHNTGPDPKASLS